MPERRFGVANPPYRTGVPAPGVPQPTTRKESHVFRAADLDELIAERPDVAVSLFMPTHVSGSQTQQDPLRFKNLLSEARSQLSALGHAPSDSARELAPAQQLMDDRDFWQHQQHGLAVFLAEGEVRTYTLPVSVTEQVVVGHGYHVIPLLPVAAFAAEAYYVVTVTSQEIGIFRASRFEMARVDYEGPMSVDGQGAGSDYQNPVQASPVARPHTGSVDISHAQVYGDSPEEWRKDRLVDFARRVATAVDEVVARDPAPTVLVAKPELSGHLQRASRDAAKKLWAVDADPASMDEAQLRGAAYAVLEPHFAATRNATRDRFQELRGSLDQRAVTDMDDLGRLAQEGRIDTLLISEPAPSGVLVEGAPTPNASTPSAGQLNALVAGTLSRSGSVQMVPAAELAEHPVAAILRF